MLLSLNVRDFVIVDQLDLDFHAGFTVLTGETGAGKSIILDALGLLMGDRADAGQIRDGAERAEIAAQFSIHNSPDLRAWLQDNELSGDEDDLLIRRLVDRNGRSRSFIYGQQATQSQLKAIGEYLVDIHGQHAHQSLMRADTQRALLDAYAGSTQLARDVREAWQDWQQARRQREDAERLSRESEVERERLTWQINELSELNLQADEWPQLNQQHSRLANAAELAQTAQLAVDVQDQVQMQWPSQWRTRMPMPVSLLQAFLFSKAVCLVYSAAAVVRTLDKVATVMEHRHLGFKQPLMKMVAS